MRTTALRPTTAALFVIMASGCDRADTTGDAPGRVVATSCQGLDDGLEHGPRTAEELRKLMPGATTIAHDDARSIRHRGTILVDGERFTGLREKRSAGGGLLGLTSYRHGLAEGWSLAWFDSGEIRERRFWKAGRKHGTHVGWWENGELRLELNFAAGEFEGVCREWHRSGRLASMRTYRRGEEDGPQMSWSADGSLVANYVVREGRRFGTIGSRPCFTVVDGAQAPGRTATGAEARAR